MIFLGVVMSDAKLTPAAKSGGSRNLSPVLNVLWTGGGVGLKRGTAAQVFNALVEAANLAARLWPEFYQGDGLARLVYPAAAPPSPEIAETAQGCGMVLTRLDMPMELANEQCDLVLADSLTAKVSRGLPLLAIGSAPRDVPLEVYDGMDALLPGLSGAPAHAASPSEIARMVFSPPRAPGENEKLRDYQNEEGRRSTPRFEYEALLRCIGEKPASAAPPDLSWEEVAALAERTGDACAATLAKLHAEFERADRQALAYGQRWRSSLASRSFMLLLASVTSGLVGTLFPRFIFVTVPIQVFATAWMYIDRQFAVRWRWREKWLEYRSLAEHARIARFCVLARAPLPGAVGSASWLDWRLRRIVHSAPPIGPLGEAQAAEVLDHLRRVEIADQIAYHHAAFRRFRRLDARLKRAAVVALFSTMAVGCLFAVLALAGLRARTIPLTSALSLCLSAAPGLYAALASLRTQLDVARQAQRSGRIAAGLRRLRRALADAQASPALVRAAALRAAGIMSQDVEGWERVMEIV